MNEKIIPHIQQQEQNHNYINGPVKYHKTMLKNLQLKKPPPLLKSRKSTVAHRQEINEFITELNNNEHEKFQLFFLFFQITNFLYFEHNLMGPFIN
jgi:hypothetical protein